MRAIIAALKFFLFALNCVWVIIFQSIVLLFTRGPASYYLPFLWHKICCLIFGIRVHVKGAPHVNAQTLYMSNHISYLDIPVLGTILKCSLVAKSEVEGWPLFGFLAGLQQTAFIRRSRTKIVQEKNALQQRLESGDSLVIFPEGTSTSGFDVAPFKSSLFSLAMDDDNDALYIQPVTIRLLSVNGTAPTSKAEQDIYAWPRDVDIEMHHHLWRFAKTSGATLEVIFHTPLSASAYKDRKILAKTCHERVSKGLDMRSTILVEH